MTAFVMLVVGACGEITGLVLDGDWTLRELRAENVIEDDLDDWIVVAFNNSDDTVTFTTGDDWPDALPDFADTYSFEIEGGRSGTITLRDTGDEAIHSTINYELENGTSRMRWVSWELQDGTEIVNNDDGTIRYLLFDR